jgi:LEA14-like dessication related protein
MVRVLLVAVAALSLSCTLLRELAVEAMGPPTATFGGEAVAGASLDQATLKVSYVVTNPNPVSVSLTAAQMTLAVGGKPVDVRGPAAGLRIPPNGRSTLDFSALVRFQELGLLGQPAAPYRAQGSLSFTTPLGPSTLPLEHAGELAVPRTPEVAVSLPRLTALALDGVTLEVPVQVKNANPFPLTFSLQGSLELGGPKVATASGPEEQVAAGEARIVGLPVRIAFDAVASVSSAMRAGSARVVFEGALRSGAVTVPVRLSDSILLPKLELKGVSFSDLSLEGVTVVVAVGTENPLPIGVDLGPSRLAVSLDGKKVAELQTPPETRLAPGAGELRLPVRFGFGSLLTAAVPMGKPQTAKLRVEGALALPTPIGVFQVPVNETRPLEMPRLPELTFAGLRLSSVTLANATVAVEMNLVNRNAFAIPSVRAGGALALSGIRVGEISSGDLGEVEAGGARRLTTQLTLDFLRTASAAQAVRSNAVSMMFDGSVSSGSLTLPLKWSQSVALTR